MRMIFILFTMFPSWYLLSFAKYTWKDNKLAGIGSILLAIVSVVFPALVLILRS